MNFSGRVAFKQKRASSDNLSSHTSKAADNAKKQKDQSKVSNVGKVTGKSEKLEMGTAVL